MNGTLLKGSIFAWLCVSLILVSGCGSAPPVVSIQGASDLNAGGNAANVRVYQLSNNTNFLNTSIEAFWRSDEEAIGDELLSSESFLLYPNSVEEFELEVDENARYIGVAVDLRQPDRERWRAVYPATDLKKKRIVVSVRTDHLELQVQ